jgi:hypothetical protein
VITYSVVERHHFDAAPGKKLAAAPGKNFDSVSKTPAFTENKAHQNLKPNKN